MLKISKRHLKKPLRGYTSSGNAGVRRNFVKKTSCTANDITILTPSHASAETAKGISTFRGPMSAVEEAFQTKTTMASFHDAETLQKSVIV